MKVFFKDGLFILERNIAIEGDLEFWDEIYQEIPLNIKSQKPKCVIGGLAE